MYFFSLYVLLKKVNFYCFRYYNFQLTIIVLIRGEPNQIQFIVIVKLFTFNRSEL